LPPGVAQQLKDRATRCGQTLEEYLQGLAVREAGVLPTGPEPTLTYPPEFSSPEEWSKALREWAANHPRVQQFVDDSRESIYAGRGE
jgi:hypothetical protein